MRTIKNLTDERRRLLLEAEALKGVQRNNLLHQAKRCHHAVLLIEAGITAAKLQKQLTRVERKIALVRAQFPHHRNQSKEQKREFKQLLKPLFEQERMIYFLTENDPH